MSKLVRERKLITAIHKKCLAGVLCLVLVAIWPMMGYSAPARLGIVLAQPGATLAGDLLTAELSGQTDVQLLERADIDKVYREQSLSAQNTDLVKLGQILGADGLLEISVVQSEDETKLSARLMAAKQGVVLLAQSFSWPNPHGQRAAEIPLTDWAPLFVKQLMPLFPKLTILNKNAIPVSVVNFRSATQSAAGMDEERGMRLLTIERLSRVPELFVLERQRMESLSEEKDLKRDDSPFWNGAYLIDGVLDASGYSAQTITVSAHVTPPKGGRSILIEVSGSRTNLAEVVELLTDKISKALQLNPAPVEWKTTDEAAEFLVDAKWALRWELYPEAETAAESAWALGRRDMDCATTRIRSYMAPPNFNKQFYHSAFASGPMTLPPSQTLARAKPPTTQTAERAQRGLELYLQFSKTLNPDELKSGSPWVLLGIDALESASKHLQHFWLALPAMETLAENFAGVRASARSVTAWITGLPAVRKTYFAGDRTPTPDERHEEFEDHKNIFQCELQWGSFWQERPEDTLAFYRELATGSRFPWIHLALLKRPAGQPRFVSWNTGSRNVDSSMWQTFAGELNSSTNPAFVMESKLIAFADAKAAANVFDLETGVENMISGEALETIKKRIDETRDAFFSYVLTNYNSIVSANNQLLYKDWEYFNLGDYATESDQVRADFKKNIAPRLSALREEWLARVAAQEKERADTELYEKQRDFLDGLCPYDFQEFNQLFRNRAYSKAQAAELIPLIDAYRSNLVSQADVGNHDEKFKAESNAHWVEFFLERPVREILNPPAPSAQAPALRPKPAANPIPAPIASSATNSPVTRKNTLLVKQFYPVPPISGETNELGQTNKLESMSQFAHSLNEGRFLLGMQYQWWEFDGRGGGRQKTTAAISIFDTLHNHWESVQYPELPSDGPTLSIPAPAEFIAPGAPFALFGGQLFLSGSGDFQRFDFSTRQWTRLNLADSPNARLFVVNNRLFAVNRESISEITEGGKSSRLLASVRRRPEQSLLDSMNEFGRAILCAGPNNTLRVTFNGAIYTWRDSDWHNDGASLGFAELAGEAVLFHERPLNLWILWKSEASPLLCLTTRMRPGPMPGISPSYLHPPGGMRPGSAPAPANPPIWNWSGDPSEIRGCSVAYQSNLFFLADNSDGASEANYDGQLVCLLIGVHEPIFVPLKFEEAKTPVNSPPSSRRVKRTSWMEIADDHLFISRGGRPGIWSIPLGELPLSSAGSP